MGLLDIFRYGFSPDVSEFLYHQIPLFLLLSGGLFMAFYLLLSLSGAPPQGPLAIAAMIVALSASFLLMTQSFGYWLTRNVGTIFLFSQGLSIAIIIVFLGMVAYLILAK